MRLDGREPQRLLGGKFLLPGTLLLILSLGAADCASRSGGSGSAEMAEGTAIASRVNELADAYVRDYFKHFPDDATAEGYPGADHGRLTDNSLDAGGSVGRVWIRRDSRSGEDGFCRIVVADDGPGIAPGILQRVFDPFFTTKDTGTGLGLAIVHRIAESNGGTVSAGNRSGGGAEFVLSVPLARGDNRGR